MENKKTYVGTAKQKNINTKFGEMEVIKLSFSKKDLETLMANLNEKGWVNLDQVKRKEVGKYGETHSITIDTWKPSIPGNTPSKPKQETVLPDSDLPFILFVG